MTPQEAIQEYQCPGCVSGPYPDCFVQSKDSERCEKHCAGTIISQIGIIFLGMPKGFNRLGFADKTKISIFSDFKRGWGYDKFNYPVWKYLDKHGNTIVRGICPRLNDPWIHIYLGDYRDDINCLEITDNDINEMD